MKMTPERKALIEYGKAIKCLEIAKKQLAKELSWYASRHQARDYNNLDIIIRDAWQKRAACRAWVPMAQRECRTCRYLGYNCPHYDCIQGIYLEDFCYWEPRKEGE